MNKLKKYLREQLINKSRDHFKEGQSDPLDFPRIAHIENTNACPAKCIICAMDKMTRKVGIMDFGLFERLIRECATHIEVKEVHLHGFGEPLVDKDLPRKVALAKKLGIPETYIVTNAFLLNKQKAQQLILAGLDGIKFSFYGMTKETYERIHVGLSFAKTVSNIEGFFEERDRLQASNPKVSLQFCPGVAPAEEFQMFLDKWRPFMDADRGDEFYSTGLHNWAGGRAYADLKIPESRRHCTWPFKDIQVFWDGRVVPCVFDYNGDSVLGDTNKATIQEIWVSENYERFRRVWRKKQCYSLPLCRKCDEPDGFYRPRPLDQDQQPSSRGMISPKKRWLELVRKNFYTKIREVKISLRYRTHQ
jgi:radical SAM protein with 4Fe4S-binding SPASM domain